MIDEAVNHRRESAAQIHEHTMRAQQTAVIICNQRNKLSKLLTLNEIESQERQDLVDAATSIILDVDSTTRLTADTDSLKSQRQLKAGKVKTSSLRSWLT